MIGRFSLPLPKTSLDTLKQIVKFQHPSLMLAAVTDGNDGRAVAYMAKILGLKSTIFTPWNVLEQSVRTSDQKREQKLSKLKVTMIMQ